MKRRKCKECGHEFQVSDKHPKQEYCTREKCKRIRKNRWQRNKRKIDVDYAKDQKDAQKKWAAEHPNYWKDYRRRNETYAERNREAQRERNRMRRKQAVENKREKIAKMDLENAKTIINTEGYLLMRGEDLVKMIAKMDSVNRYCPVITVKWEKKAVIAKRGLASNIVDIGSW